MFSPFVDTLISLFIKFSGLSFLAFGGVNALLPALYELSVTQGHWITAQTFADYFAIANAAPGPNFLTLGLSIVLENLALIFFHSDTRVVETSYSLQTIQLGQVMLSAPKFFAFWGALGVSAMMLGIMKWTNLGRAIRAVAKERTGAKLMGIDVEHVYAMSFGIGLACLGAAACFLLPAYYVNPSVGNGFIFVSFTIVVLGGMGSFVGALLGGLLIGVIESLGGLYLGESLGQVGIFIVFVSFLIFRPQGMFGSKA